MNIYDNNNIPRVWKDFLMAHNMMISNTHVLVVMSLTMNIMDWLETNEHSMVSRGSMSAVIITTDQAALLKLSCS